MLEFLAGDLSHTDVSKKSNACIYKIWQVPEFIRPTPYKPLQLWGLRSPKRRNILSHPLHNVTSRATGMFHLTPVPNYRYNSLPKHAVLIYGNRATYLTENMSCPLQYTGNAIHFLEPQLVLHGEQSKIVFTFIADQRTTHA
jgi:hypothetical protein